MPPRVWTNPAGASFHCGASPRLFLGKCRRWPHPPRCSHASQALGRCPATRLGCQPPPPGSGVTRPTPGDWLAGHQALRVNLGTSTQSRQKQKLSQRKPFTRSKKLWPDLKQPHPQKPGRGARPARSTRCPAAGGAGTWALLAEQLREAPQRPGDLDALDARLRQERGRGRAQEKGVKRADRAEAGFSHGVDNPGSGIALWLKQTFSLTWDFVLVLRSAPLWRQAQQSLSCARKCPSLSIAGSRSQRVGPLQSVCPSGVPSLAHPAGRWPRPCPPGVCPPARPTWTLHSSGSGGAQGRTAPSPRWSRHHTLGSALSGPVCRWSLCVARPWRSTTVFL